MTVQQMNALLSNEKTLHSLLQALVKKGSIRQIDYQFGRFIASQVRQNSDEMGFVATLLSHELGKGHICLNFDAIATLETATSLGLYADNAHLLYQKLSAIDWLTLLTTSKLVGATGEAVPLMFDQQRVYLHRYWQYEVGLANKLAQLSQKIDLSTTQKVQLSQSLARLFAPTYTYLFNALMHASQQGESTQVIRQQLVCDHLDVVSPERLDWTAIDALLLAANKVADLNDLAQLVPLSACLSWQKVAAAVALTRRFAVISGGPGTGKTTTVAKLLSALVEQAQQNQSTLTIKLVAPTGKAAARLTESIGNAINSLPISDEIKKQIPTQSSTLHRLLGAIPNRAEFRHNQTNLLHLDVLVVDEASMIDLPMMYKLVMALPTNARLILLGDKDQLASVEAGAVLGDICSFNHSGFSAEQSKTLAQITQYSTLDNSNGASSNGLADSLCMLQKSYRFDARSGIGQLAKAINSGFANNLDSVLACGFEDIQLLERNTEHYHYIVQRLVKEYSTYIDIIHHSLDDFSNGLLHPDTDPTSSNVFEYQLRAQNTKAKAVLKSFSQCRLLCAVREGEFGVNGLNQHIERALAAKRYITPNKDEVWYQGRPIMVTQNDHALGLFNGDIGVCMLEPNEEGGRLKVYFEMSDGSIKSVLPSRVPEHETAYAMTIHKSQGSEFDLTVMVLPSTMSPVLTKELVYTGVTRAKKNLILLTDLTILKRAVRLSTERKSGLVPRLRHC